MMVYCRVIFSRTLKVSDHEIDFPHILYCKKNVICISHLKITLLIRLTVVSKSNQFPLSIVKMCTPCIKSSSVRVIKVFSIIYFLITVVFLMYFHLSKMFVITN